LYQMELPIMVGQPFHLGLESTGTIGACGEHFCVVSVLWCYLGLDLVVGPPPPGTCRKVSPFGKWNPPSWLNNLFTWVCVTGTILWCLLEHFVWFSVQWCSWGWICGRTLHHPERFGRWWRYSCQMELFTCS
jgi:hypothetical protein